MSPMANLNIDPNDLVNSTNSNEDASFLAIQWYNYAKLCIYLKEYIKLPIALLLKKDIISLNRSDICRLPDFGLLSQLFPKAKRFFDWCNDTNANTTKFESYWFLWNAFYLFFEELDVMLFDFEEEYNQNGSNSDDSDNDNDNDHDNDADDDGYGDSARDASNEKEEELVLFLIDRITEHLEQLGTVFLHLKKTKITDMEYNFAHNTVIDQLFEHKLDALKWLIKETLRKVVGYHLYYTEECQFGLRFYFTHYMTMILFLLFENDSNNDGNSNKNKHRKTRTTIFEMNKNENNNNNDKNESNKKKNENNESNNDSVSTNNIHNKRVSLVHTRAFTTAIGPFDASMIRQNSKPPIKTTHVLDIECPWKDELKPFYQLMKELGHYNACYPRQSRDEESFYLQTFSKYLIKHGSVQPNMKRLEFFDGKTLLHGATEQKMSRYAKFLVNYGFDIRQKSGKEERDRLSSYSVSIHYPSYIREFYDSILFNDENKEDDKEYHDPKAVEDSYFAVTKQTSMCDTLLHYLGYFGSTNDLKPKRKYEPLYYDYTQCENIIRICNSKKEASDMMNKLSLCMMSLIKDKQAFSEDLLMFTYDYCLKHDNTLARHYATIICDSLSDCLCLNSNSDKSSNNNNPTPIASIDINSRNYEWYKKYLKDSNIWYMKKPKPNTNAAAAAATVSPNTLAEIPTGMEYAEKEYKRLKETVSQELLYSHVTKVTDELTQKEIAFVKDQMGIAKQRQSNYFNSIKTYQYEGAYTTEPRQDRINPYLQMIDKQSFANVKSLIPSFREYDVLQISTLIDFTVEFDFFQEGNTKNYLSQCLIMAHSLNRIFQNAMKEIVNEKFNNDKCNYNSRLISHKVATYEECVFKCNSLYADKAFPNAANILDYISCTIVFDTFEHLFKALNDFTKIVEDQKENEDESKSCNNIKTILKCKNGFKKFRQKKNQADRPNASKENHGNVNHDFEYADIKFHVIVYDPKSKRAMIAEIQFTLNWMYHAKKMSDPYSSIQSKKGFIAKVYQKIWNDETKYKNRIEYLMNDRNAEAIKKHVLIRENELLSFLNYRRPMLYELGKNKCYDGFNFWVSSLKHYASVIGNVNSKRHNNSSTSDGEKKSNDEYSVAEQIANKKMENGDWIIKYMTCTPQHIMDDTILWGIGLECLDSDNPPGANGAFINLLRQPFMADAFNTRVESQGNDTILTVTCRTMKNKKNSMARMLGIIFQHVEGIDLKIKNNKGESLIDILKSDKEASVLIDEYMKRQTKIS